MPAERPSTGQSQAKVGGPSVQHSFAAACSLGRATRPSDHRLPHTACSIPLVGPGRAACPPCCSLAPNQLGGGCCPPSTSQASKAKGKPAWALSPAEAETKERSEEEELMAFTEQLDFDAFVEALDDLELKDAFQVEGGSGLRTKWWWGCGCKLGGRGRGAALGGGTRPRADAPLCRSTNSSWSTRSSLLARSPAAPCTPRLPGAGVAGFGRGQEGRRLHVAQELRAGCELVGL